jgi:two-component system NarL family sensor kinase
VTAPQAASGDHPVAFAAWVIAAGSTLIGLTAVFIGPHDHVPWDAALFPLMFGVPGALIAARARDNPVGWLMLVVGASFAANTVAVQYLAAGAGSGAEWWAWWVGRGGGASLVPATLLLVLLLPTGRLPGPRWRIPVTCVVLGQVSLLLVASLTRGPAALDTSARGTDGLANPLGVLPETWNTFIDTAIGPVLTVPFLLGVPVVLSRLRNADTEERSRVAGVLAGVVLFVLLVTVPDVAWPWAAMWFHIAAVVILAGGILVAVLRGNFEQIEVAVSRALLYGAFTVVVAAVYVGLVALAAGIGLGDRFAGVGTAVVALALLPARRFAQSVLRRIIYGADAGQSMSPASAVGGGANTSASLPNLSRRENEIMQHVAKGLTNAEIAAELFISPITVRNHVSSILTKLDATNRTQAAVKYRAAVRS